MRKYPNENDWQPNNEEGEELALVPYGEHIPSSEVPHRRGRIAWIIVCACVAFTVILLVIALGNATPKALQNVQVSAPDVSDTEEWRGAFSARNIYEECYQSAVTVRLGRDADGVYWSGIVIDADGWIATSLEMMDASKKGKIYVSLNDGREFSVESVFNDSESGIALLKINASGLNAAEIRDSETQGGEGMICISALEYGRSCVLSGEVSGSLDESLKINIGLDLHGVGAPLFDQDGSLVGMATAKGSDGNERILYAVYAPKCTEMLEKVK